MKTKRAVLLTDPTRHKLVSQWIPCSHQHWRSQLLKQQSYALVAAWPALLLLLPTEAKAGGVVTNCSDAALRSAMAGGGTVTFACDGTITLTNTIIVATNTLVDGSGHSILIGGPQAFYVNSNRMFCVASLRIANCCATRGGSHFQRSRHIELE